MKNKIKVSVVIPVYNVENFLKKAIESLIVQTLKDMEFIFINDGSTDNSLKIIEHYQKKDGRIKVINKKNEGAGIARNKGLELATGDYIGFLDSDDQISKNFFEILYNKAKQNNYDIVQCNYCDKKDNKYSDKKYRFIRQEIEIKDKNRSEFINNYFLKYSYGGEVWSKIYKRKLLKSNNIYFEDNKKVFGEDLLFNLYCFFFAEKIGFIDDALYYHSIREGSLMHSKQNDLVDRVLNIVFMFIKKSKELDLYDSISMSIPNLLYFVINFIISTENEFKNKSNKLKQVCEKKFVKKRLKEIYINKSMNISRKYFIFLCYHKKYKLAIFQKKVINIVVKVLRKLKGVNYEV